MSLVLADRVRETTQTTGTGTINLDGAVQGFQSFAVIGNNNTTYYTINRGSEWEVGVGTYYGGTLSRDTVYESSNSNNKVNFSAGAKDVFVTLPSEQAVTSGTDVTFTKVTTPVVQATNSSGLSLKNSAGTTQISMGGGGGDNISLNVSTNLNGTNAQIDISPTGTGHVHIKPTGVNSVEIAPTFVGEIDNVTIGGTTPAAGTFTTLIGGGGSANYFQTQGSATTKAVEAKALGSDTNIAFVIDSKGTGAIDLAAGSSGVNISNGGTVTAITRTGAGTGYTSPPTVAITAPTTAGGVQATATVNLEQTSSTSIIAGGGTGYTVNDVITVVGGTQTTPSSYTVTSVSGGVITGLSLTQYGSYSAIPSNPVSVTGGTGTGATLTIIWQIKAAFNITAAGSGYVEQPTVSFSGGGGSGAAAFATIGSTVTFKSLNDITVQLPSGPAMSIVDSGNPGTGAYLQFTNSSTSNAIQRAIGSNTNVGIFWLTKGTGGHSFNTNNSTATQQMVVSHTASAVNYVQVTGAATGGVPVISAQGSDATVGVTIQSKSASILFLTRSTNARSFNILDSVSPVNYLQVVGNTATNAPILSSQGTDTNIDLTLTPKGTGNVRFGTYTANMALTIQGYVEIKDSGGTVRRLAVIA